MVGQRLGHFEILEKLGAGGMGDVYKARDSRLDRLVAIKVLPPDFARDGIAVHRLQREARIVASLSHPHICALFEVGHENGTDFLVMEHLEGETLAGRLKRGKLPVAVTLQYGVQIAGAVAAAHTAGIVHRDLKPGNVMLTKNGAKLLDFGLAKQREGSPHDDAHLTQSLVTHTAEGTISGTVGYMSPEQAEGKLVDTRSDIFSFGSLLYEMVSGQRAFRGDSGLATLAAILEKDPAPLGAELPAELRKIIARCLRKNPDERYQHISDVRIAFEEIERTPSRGRRQTRAQGYEHGRAHGHKGAHARCAASSMPDVRPSDCGLLVADLSVTTTPSSKPQQTCQVVAEGPIPAHRDWPPHPSGLPAHVFGSRLFSAPIPVSLRVYRPHVVVHDLRRDRAPEHIAGILIEAPVDAAVDACVVHVGANGFELRVVLADERRGQHP
jgi:serine/threonine protein kinase